MCVSSYNAANFRWLKNTHTWLFFVFVRYTKLKLQVNQEGKIPVKKWVPPSPTTFKLLLTSSFFSSSLSLFHFLSRLFYSDSDFFLCLQSLLRFLTLFACTRHCKHLIWMWFCTLSFSVIKMFSDKKRVETALEQCGLINNKVITQ